MAAKVCRFAGLFLTALALGGAFAHLLGMRNKLALGREGYFLVQRHLYEGWGDVLGPVETGALVSALLMLLLVRERRGAFLWTLAATLSIAAALVVWQVWVGPVNARVDSWGTGSDMPADWRQLRASWEYGHAARAVLFALAFASLLVPTLADAPAKAELPRAERRATRGA